MATIQEHAFWLLLAYGAIASLAFVLMEPLRASAIALFVYGFGFLGLFLLYAPVPIGRYGILGVIIGVLQVAVILAFNGLPLYTVLDHLVTRLGRELFGLNQMVFRKSYDRAKAAEARGELAEATALYRRELEDDPKDTAARRLLAEVLVKRGLAQEAAAELQAVLEHLKKDERQERIATLLRLAEVSEEELRDEQRARQLYREVIEQDPAAREADYARGRLGRGDPTEAPTD
jgi:tetratricopeptide (TPR) repeat protein